MSCDICLQNAKKRTRCSSHVRAEYICRRNPTERKDSVAVFKKCRYNKDSTRLFLEVVYVVAKRTSVRISSRWLKLSLLYQHFSRDWSHICDYSRQAQEDAYLFDSLGQKPPPRELRNGFILGKQWMGVTLSMWKEDLPKGLLFRRELYEDPNYPHWWLDQVLPAE